MLSSLIHLFLSHTNVGQQLAISNIASVIHLSWLIVVVLWLRVFNIVVTLGVSHWLVQISLVLSLLHMQREILVVTIHIRSICVR